MDPPWDLNGLSDAVDVSVAWDVGASKRTEGVAGVARNYTRNEKQIGNKATHSTIKKRAIKSIIKKGMPCVVSQISLRALRASAIKA